METAYAIQPTETTTIVDKREKKEQNTSQSQRFPQEWHLIYQEFQCPSRQTQLDTFLFLIFFCPEGQHKWTSLFWHNWKSPSMFETRMECQVLHAVSWPNTSMSKKPISLRGISFLCKLWLLAFEVPCLISIISFVGPRSNQLGSVPAVWDVNCCDVCHFLLLPVSISIMQNGLVCSAPWLPVQDVLPFFLQPKSHVRVCSQILVAHAFETSTLE